MREDSDDVFAFIAGYMEGSVPHGMTWSELGLEPYIPYDELMEAYGSRDGQQERNLREREGESMDGVEWF